MLERGNHNIDDDYEVVVQNIGLVCKHCGHTRFRQQEGQLNTAMATFFGFDWLNQSADVFVCAACGFLHWFLGVHFQEMTGEPGSGRSGENKVIADSRQDVSYATACLDCGKVVPVGQTQCASCGWTYSQDS